MTKSQTVSATEVREWAKSRGLTVAEHGRLNFEVIEKYNKAHRSRRYEPTLSQPPKVLSLTKRKGGKLAGTVKATHSDIRAWAAKNGHALGQRGRIPREVLTAFASAA